MGYNGPGPWTVENNYLEAAGENILVGGASPKIPNLIPADLIFRYNHLFKPVAWRAPILATPGAPSAAAAPGGALPAGTVSYRVVAARKTAQDAWVFSTRSLEVAVPVAAGDRVTLSWPAVPNATIYRVYRGTAAGAQDRYFDSAEHRVRRRRHAGRDGGDRRHDDRHGVDGQEPVRAEARRARHRRRQRHGELLAAGADRLRRAVHAAEPGQHLAVDLRARRAVHQQRRAPRRQRDPGAGLRQQRAPASRRSGSRSATTSSTTSPRAAGAAAAASCRSARAPPTSSSITTSSSTRRRSSTPTAGPMAPRRPIPASS